MTTNTKCPEGGRCDHPEGVRDCLGFEAGSAGCAYLAEPGCGTVDADGVCTTCGGTGLYSPGIVCGDCDAARIHFQAVSDRYAAADAADKPTPEETATRAYLTAMVAAGWSIEHHWWVREFATDASDEEIAAHTHKRAVSVDEMIDILANSQASHGRCSASYELRGPEGGSVSCCAVRALGQGWE